MTSFDRKKQLQLLVNEYKDFKKAGKLNLSSEETIRTWLNAMLKIFGWDVRDTSQILQEKVLSKSEKERLKSIGSSSTRPDYTFKIAKQKLTFLDAKSLQVNLRIDSKAAFQIKSYGWSIQAPCAFISNFEQFVIYNCTYIPKGEQPANFGRIFISIDNYIDNFEILEQHLLKENIYNGKLDELYNAKIKGVDTVSPDFAFADLLSEFRLFLATDIYKNNSGLIDESDELLSYVVQVIINRILFIRVCEARRIEEEGLLLHFQSNGFWNSFKQSSYFDFYEHYDGSLFDRIDIIHQLKVSDEVFNQILEYLYEPSPYRFDVIPTKLLSDIYEIFLAKKLKIKNGKVKDELKSEYSKTKGAVSTPQYMVQEIIRRTIPVHILQEKTIKQFLDTKILDIACGSGVFAIETYDYLEEILKVIYQKTRSVAFKDLFVENEHELLLTIQGKKAILDNCIFGIDIDPEAVEVAKMALALKIVDSTDYPQSYEAIGLFGGKILDGVGKNIRCGNSIVDSSIYEQYPDLLSKEKQLIKTNAFDWNSEDGFSAIFETKKGFDFIIGNPPYVEVKHYNEELPFMHRFIKYNYPASKNGKIDLAIPFIEKAISLLNDRGRLGFIVQKRFFKTAYGKKIREIITQNELVSSIIDFETTKIFKGRITYVAILILDKSPKESFYYKLFKAPVERLSATLRETTLPELNPSNYYQLPNTAISKAPWSFDNPTLIRIRTQLQEFGTLGSLAKVKVGIQVLWDRAYHIRPISIENGILRGNSHLEKDIQIELAACRPLICNEQFTPYRSDKADVYVIFPYEIENGKANKMLFSNFSKRFPLAAEYLIRHKSTIQENVQTLSSKFPERYDDEYWHLYTREQNHSATYPKVLIPMTALDTFATLTFSDKPYCDNVNVNFIAISNKSETNLYALSGVINSTVFSVLARSIANPQTNSYFKFNKQFIEPVPFPVQNFENNMALKSEIADLVKKISNLQKTLKKTPKNTQQRIIQPLKILWKQLDEKVYQLYNLNEEEIAFFNQRGRAIDRVGFLLK